MGNNQNKETTKKNWKRIKNSNLLINVVTYQKIQQFMIEFPDKQTWVANKNIYEKRKLNQYIVQVYHYQPIQKKSWLCQNSIRIKLYLQYIPLTLYQSQPFQEHIIIEILSQTLKGFKELFYKSSIHFQISDRMIGFNKQGKVKVWVNPNFEQNYPTQVPILYMNKDQYTKEYYLVKRIFDVIQKHCIKRRYSNKFHDLISNKKHTFKSAISLIDDYKTSKQIKLNLMEEIKFRNQKNRGLSLSDFKKGSLQFSVTTRAKEEQQGKNIYSGVKRLSFSSKVKLNQMIQNKLSGGESLKLRNFK